MPCTRQTPSARTFASLSRTCRIDAINTGATYGFETEEENENYIMMQQEIFFFYEFDAMVHEKTSYDRLDEQNNNRLAYNPKQQLILKAVLTKQKSDTDSVGKNESELKSESKEVLQKAQEYLNQHRHQLEQEIISVEEWFIAIQSGCTYGSHDEGRLRRCAKEGHQQLTEF